MQDKLKDFLNDEPWLIIDESKADFLNKKLKKNFLLIIFLTEKKLLQCADQ
ncbi:hypothetical protein [Neobacillus sp. PS2-9]|uniref:hypothetical protein n=1 Tax=Neobacillus sp. PS2-9 TaxID=3070676 RepID=UPI0027DF2E07|nr:hypothetical protein [Neobacillus sp. PS2-9]WML58644.1 hypothetical protein RCG25_02290 [Neobacillus sp. PS2-9]